MPSDCSKFMNYLLSSSGLQGTNFENNFSEVDVLLQQINEQLPQEIKGIISSFYERKYQKKKYPSFKPRDYEKTKETLFTSSKADECEYDQPMEFIFEQEISRAFRIKQ